MVGVTEHPHVVVHEHHGVTVVQEVIYHTEQALDVGRVQADGRLVKHVEHAVRAVAHGAGELHALALARRKRGTRAVEAQIAEPQLLQAADGLRHLGHDGLGHGLELLRHERGHARRPYRELIERHACGIAERHAIDHRPARSSRKARAAAIGTHVLAQELGHAREPLFVLGLGERVLHRVDSIEVGEVQLREVVTLLGVVEDVLLLRRAMEDDVALLGRELAKRHVRAHAHLPRDLFHEVPHEGVPRGNRALVDGEGLVRHERGLVHRAHDARSAAGGACARAVEGKVLRTGAEELPAA